MSSNEREWCAWVFVCERQMERYDGDDDEDEIDGWPILLKERNGRVNKWWRIDVSALREEMKLSSWGDCLTRTQTPKILMKMKAACVCIHMSACMSAFLDFQQGEFGSGQSYFDWEVEQTTGAESHIHSDADSCYVPGEMFIVLWRFAILVKHVVVIK